MNDTRTPPVRRLQSFLEVASINFFSKRVTAAFSRSGGAPCACCIALFLLLSTTSVWAHKESDSYLTVRVENGSVNGEWHLALRDLEDALGLDQDNNGAITWGELKSAEPLLSSYAVERLQIDSPGQRGSLRIRELLAEEHSDGTYAVLRFGVDGLERPRALHMRYRALFDIDPGHRGLLQLSQNGQTRLAVFSPDASAQEFQLQDRAPGLGNFTFLREGIGHIWGGYDHLLFLIALLLPAALGRVNQQWVGQEQPRAVVTDVLRTVTAFTVAHSITLSLAGLGLVRLPVRVVEAAIAFSVLLAAANNIRPFFTGRSWMLAFAFGLIHGFGFANALADLGLARGSFVRTLFEFNLGVEIGQLVIVLMVLPVLLALRDRTLYRRVVLPLGSFAIAAVATLWFVERAGNYRFLPF